MLSNLTFEQRTALLQKTEKKVYFYNKRSRFVNLKNKGVTEEIEQQKINKMKSENLQYLTLTQLLRFKVKPKITMLLFENLKPELISNFILTSLFYGNSALSICFSVFKLSDSNLKNNLANF